ncbi:MAG: glycosyltransferase family 4 protein [Actinomycetota bacterium]
MRLLVVTNDFPPAVGGIENYTYSLARRWPSADVTVVTRQVPGASEFDAEQPFRIIRKDTGTLLPTRSLAAELRRLVEDERIDAVHFPSALPLGLLGRRLGRPYLLSVHGGEFRLASRLPAARQLLRRVCSGARLILPESSFAEGLVREFLPDPVALVTIRCGVDVERYRPGAVEPVKLRNVEGPAQPGAVEGPVIVSVSRLVARKGPRTLVRCLPAILLRFPDAHLLIVGGGPDLELLKEMAVKLGVASSVTFAGPQPWATVPSYYAAGTLFAQPTRTRFFGIESEGLPLAFCEAAAAGLPLIGGDSGGVSEAVRPGVSGILVSGGNEEQTTAAILQLLEDPVLAEKLGKGARAMAEQDFDWDVLAAHYRAAIQEHCSRPVR